MAYKKVNLSEILNKTHSFYIKHKYNVDNAIIALGGITAGSELVSKVMKTDYMQGLETFLINSLYISLIKNNFGKNSRISKVLDKVNTWSSSKQKNKSKKNILKKPLQTLENLTKNGAEFFRNENLEKGALISGVIGYFPLIHTILNGSNSEISMLKNIPSYGLALLVSYLISRPALNMMSLKKDQLKTKSQRISKNVLTLCAVAYLTFSAINLCTDYTLFGTKRLKSDPKKKLFLYSQNIDNADIEKCLNTYADYQMPHMFKLERKNGSKEIGLFQIYQDSTIINYVNTQHKHKSKVLPMISAFSSNVLNEILKNPNKFSELIANNIKNLNMDGVLIDFESIKVGSKYSDDLTMFMKLLREKLPDKKYEIGIAVSPRFQSSERKGFAHHGFYDFEALSKYVNYINVMAYDFHKGVFGPILPEDKLNKLVDYTIDHVPKEKIVISFPFYGYVWDSNKKEIGTLSWKYNDNYLSIADTTFIDNGELRIETKDRLAYVQTEETFNNRFKLLNQNKIYNVAGWKVEFMGSECDKTIKNWKKKVERRYTHTKAITQKNKRR